MAEPVELPGDGPAVVGDVVLPPGRRLFANGGSSDVPVLWATNEPIAHGADLWQSLRQAGTRSGLVPVFLTGIGGDVGKRPWDTGGIRPRPSGGTDRAASLLAQWWSMGIPDPEEDEEETTDPLAPFSRAFPGLAPRCDASLPDEVMAEELRAMTPARLGLVRAARPADVLAVIGWDGAVNTDQDPDDLSAVLGSWEERFGATLIGIGSDTIDLLVERPPEAYETAVRVAAEHFAFCSDAVYQGAASIRVLAEELVGAAMWSFWWD